MGLAHFFLGGWMRVAAVAALAVRAASLLPGQIADAAAPPPNGCDNPDSLGVASGFSEFVHHNATRISDSEGRVGVGGNATLGSAGAGIGFSVGSGQPVDSVGVPLPPDPQRHDLIVGGALAAHQVVVLQAGAVYGSLTTAPGTVTSSVRGSIIAGAPSEYAGGLGPIDFDAEFDYLQSASTRWGELAANGTTELHGSGSNVFLDLEGVVRG